MSTTATANHQTALEPLTVSPAEAAALLGCGKNRIYELIRAGRLPVVRLSTARAAHKQIPRRALEEFVNAGGAS